jgi:ankyrin repeat protein
VSCPAHRGMFCADGITLLMLAAHRGFHEVTNLLLESHIDVGLRDKCSRTALHYCVEACCSHKSPCTCHRIVASIMEKAVAEQRHRIIDRRDVNGKAMRAALLRQSEAFS